MARNGVVQPPADAGGGEGVGDRVAVNISNQIIEGEKVSVRESSEDSPKATK